MRDNRASRRLAMLLAVAVMVMACGNKDGAIIVEDSQQQPEASTVDTPCVPTCSQKECGSDGCGGICGECEGANACTEDGACEPVTCTSSKDCPGLLICNGDSGQCVQCEVDQDCPDGETCGPDNACHVPISCDSDVACKLLDQVCDKDAGLCVDCLDDAQCLAEEYCIESFCLGDKCEGGTKRCADAQTVETCQDNGSGWTQEACNDGWYCADGDCLELACPPGESWCEGGVAYECSDDGLSIVEEDDCSEAGKACVDGECLDCTPDCNGKECGDDGCGGSCGECSDDMTCEGGTCQPSPGLVWVTIPAGSYMMGCSPNDVHCLDSEYPVHLVDVESFQILETEVTQAQYETLLGNNPSCNLWPGGPNSPVECVSWDESVVFCETVGGRLCTEAEWEYAARGGTTTKYYCGDNAACLDSIAWFEDNNDTVKYDVKGKLPNDYGLYDMLGNVTEWTADCWHPSYAGAPSTAFPSWEDSECVGGQKAYRGGYAGSPDKALSVSRRWFHGHDHAENHGGGFRCCRSLSP